MRALSLFAALFVPLALPAFAEGAAAVPAGRIVVVGRASRELPPDFASVQIGVVGKAPGAGAALDANSAAARRIGEEARAFGIEPRDIQTSAVSLTQAYRTQRDAGGIAQQQPDGYQATNRVEVRMREIGRLGEFVRRVVEAGANRIDGISFGLADPGAALVEAESSAVADALGRARRMAAAAGASLGVVQEINAPPRQEARPFAMPMRAERRLAAAPLAVPVEAGSLEVSAEVEVVWSLRQP